MGEGVSSQTRDKICHLVEGDEHVIKVQHILSTYQSPNEVLMMLIVAFHEDMDTSEINAAIDRIRDKVKHEFQFVRFVMIQPESLEHHVLWNDDKH